MLLIPGSKLNYHLSSVLNSNHHFLSRSPAKLNIYRAGCLLFFILLLTACSSGGGGSDGPASSSCETGIGVKTLCAIQISGATSEIVIGGMVDLVATGIYSDQTKADVTERVQWSSLVGNVASISNTAGNKGRVTALATGSTTISAALEGKQAAMQLNVSQAVLIAIELSQNSIVLPNGTQTTIRATGRYSNNVTLDISSIAEWSLQNNNIASLSINDSVTILGVNVGDTILSVALQGLTVTAEVSVTNAALDEIVIEPVRPDVVVGNTAQLVAMGRFSDNVMRDITDQVVWQSSNETIISISSANSPGEFYGVSAGAATITASLSNQVASTNMTVSNAALVDITITPSFISIARGTAIHLTAIGIYSDNSTRDITDSVVWVTIDPSIVIIENAQLNGGLLKALSAGETTISALLDGVSAQLPVTVTDAELVSINIQPIQSTVAVGTQIQFSALANFSDGSVQDISRFATWSSSNKDVAVIQSNSDHPGNVFTLAAGISTITASMAGKTGSTSFTVSTATLTSITIDQADFSLVKGTSTRLSVTAHFSDATTQDFTSAVNWTSSQPTMVAVDSNDNNAGFVHALELGTAIITASVNGDIVPAVAINITVADAMLETISITPQNSSIPNRATLQYQAIGHFSDNSSQDITELVTWSILDTEIAQVSNVAGEKGLVVGVVDAVTGNGVTEVKAAFHNGVELITATSDLGVTYEPQRPIFVAPFAQSNVIINNGADSSTIQAFVKASENGATVADGTVVEFEIVSGNGVLSAPSASTIDGIASVSLTSSSEGFVVVQVTVQNTQISNFVVILSTSSFANVVIPFAAAEYDYDEQTKFVQPGSVFTLYIFNIGNRTFSLDRYDFMNGNETLKTVTEFEVVNNQLVGGVIYGVVLNVIPELVVDTDTALTAQFILTDTASGQTFVVSHTYDLTP